MATAPDFPPTDDDGQTNPEEEQAEAARLRSVEDLADEVPEQEAEPRLFGTTEQLTLNVGGRKKPQSSTAKLKSGQVEVEGQFTPDDVVELRVLARVDAVTFTSKRDGDGDIKEITRSHTFTPLKIERASGVAESE